MKEYQPLDNQHPWHLLSEEKKKDYPNAAKFAAAISPITLSDARIYLKNESDSNKHFWELVDLLECGKDMPLINKHLPQYVLETSKALHPNNEESLFQSKLNNVTTSLTNLIRGLNECLKGEKGEQNKIQEIPDLVDKVFEKIHIAQKTKHPILEKIPTTLITAAIVALSALTAFYFITSPVPAQITAGIILIVGGLILTAEAIFKKLKANESKQGKSMYSFLRSNPLRQAHQITQALDRAAEKHCTVNKIEYHPIPEPQGV